MRVEIFNKLKEITSSVYNVGKHPGTIEEPTLILKYNSQIVSVNNSKGGFQRLEVMCYIPQNYSILELDNLITNVINKIQELNNIEHTGEITPEFADNDMNAIMRSIYFYIPKEVR